LSLAQEKELIGDIKLLIVAVSALNQITAEEMAGFYELTMPEVVKCLARLDRIGFLELLPNNRVKLLVARTFRWIPNGPIQTWFRHQAAGDFLNSRFDGEQELLQLVNVMLSKESIPVLMKRLQQLSRELSQQHQDDARLPLAERYAMSFVLAARPWMPRDFLHMVRRHK
jgi:hypothetical protein